MPAKRLLAKAVDLEPTPARLGYWIVDSNGVVHTFGDAKRFGNPDPRTFGAGETISSLSSSPTGRGYWIFTSRGRGRVLPFGMELNGPVLDSISTPSGAGYYMVASDGGIFAFGDARFAGSMGGRPLNSRSSRWCPTGTAPATGWSPPTGAFSPSTLPSVVRWAERRSTSRSPGWSATATDTSWWRPTAASSRSPTSRSPGRWAPTRPAQPIVSVAATG